MGQALLAAGWAGGFLPALSRGTGVLPWPNMGAAPDFKLAYIV
jgi:hypothetical protein